MSGLVLKGVEVRIGAREILRGLDLAVSPGEILTLVGPNGAGKTTALRVASRVLPTTSGEVTLAGRPLGAWSRRELARKVAVVPQDAQFAFPFRVGEVVLMGRAPHQGFLGFESRDDVALARSALGQLGIADFANRSVLELSGGERQLVLMARALAQDPEVLLLDEPTAHLDLHHRVAVLEQVTAVAAAGRAVLLVSHDLTLAARTGHRMALLADGRVLASGPPGQVLTKEHLRQAFHVEADIHPGADGAPVVVPTATC